MARRRTSGGTVRVCCAWLASTVNCMQVSTVRRRINRGGGRAYRYDGKKWIDCGAPDGRNFESLLPLNGKLYASTHGNVYQYEGGQSWKMIGDAPFGISQIHSMEAVNGKVVIGTWPQGYVLRYEDDGKWSITGRLGLPEGQPKINEINDLTVYNGKLYAGVIPLSEVLPLRRGQ